MGKLGPRLSSRKKAKRWLKGQSSSSNPNTRKYRDQARSRFFQENLGLTVDGLRRHDSMQKVQPASEKIEVDGDEETVDGTFKTFNTFASDWSNCSNLSFSRFLSRFQASSVIHKEMLAILAAVTDVIKQNGGTESSTEYYAALMTTLKVTESEESVAAVLSLLGMGLKTVPRDVLRLQFGQACQTFLQILTKYATSDNFLILRTCIGCLSLLLRVPEIAVWSDSSTLQVLDAVLAFTVHTKPRVRKAAQHAICAILKGSDIMNGDDPPVYHPGAPQVAKHCLAQLEAAGQPGGITSTLHVLTLLKDISHQLPKSYLKSVCEALLRIMTLNNVLVTSCCLQTLHGLFVSRPSEAILPSQLNAQIINALYDYQPTSGDTQPTLAWLAVMQEAHSNLAANSLALCAANISRIIEKCTELWLSDKTEVLTGASHTIKTLLQVCVGQMCNCEQDTDKYKPVLTKIIQLIQQGMKYQYNSAWHHVLHLLALLFQIAGRVCKDELLGILMALAELRDSYKFTYNSEVEYAVGAAIMAMGPQVVLTAIPLQTNRDEIDINRSWLLPVLKDCVKQASLSYYIESLLPLAIMCEKKSAALKASNDTIKAHSYELLTSQIWALLPSFCNHPNDIKDAFKNIAKILGMAISEKKDLRLSVMASLRKLVTRSVESNNIEDMAELARFAKNYLPLLFNLYTIKPNGSDEEGQRLAALDTIKVYLTITGKDLTGELFDRAVTKLEEPETGDFFKESVFDLIRILVPFTDGDRLKILYEKLVPLFTNDKKQKEQKKAYRFLEDICGSDNDLCKEFVRQNRRTIQKLLIKSLPSTATTSKGVRLRCLSHLVRSQTLLKETKLLKAVLPEVVLSIKHMNEKCRMSAYRLLNDIAEKLLDNAEYFKEFIDILVAGLAGVSTYCSATLLALASVTYNYNGSLGAQTVQQILEHACLLATVPTREIVLSALSYIKVYLSVMPSPTVAPNLSSIVKALSGMTDDCKRHFRQKVRDLLIKLARKYSVNTIMEMIPTSDEMMHKRLKNIRKVETRKQKAKELKKTNKTEEGSDEEFNVKSRPKSMEEILADSDEDFEDPLTDEQNEGRKKTSRRKTWIQENEDNIVDFIDPAAVKCITATQPGTSSTDGPKRKIKSDGFKTAADGRLIIRDDDDDDDNGGGDASDGKVNRQKKKNTVFSEVDSERDSDNEDTKSMISVITTGRKRKHSDSTDVASTRLSMKYQAGGSGIHRSTKATTVDKTPGIEYRAKKAMGDVKKKGKPDPFAYLPLTRSTLNRRKKMKNAGRFKGIVTGAKRGARIGTKNKGRRNRA